MAFQRKATITIVVEREICWIGFASLWIEELTKILGRGWREIGGKRPNGIVEWNLVKRCARNLSL